MVDEIPNWFKQEHSKEKDLAKIYKTSAEIADRMVEAERVAVDKSTIEVDISDLDMNFEK